MNIPVLAINLDRSKDRWERLSSRASSLDIGIERVPAIDGNAVAPEMRSDLDSGKFQLWHGRKPMGAEYGCYMSHIRALDRIIDNEWQQAVILEDDADLPSDFIPRIEALARLTWDVVKIHNHRTVGFMAKAKSDTGDVVGRCVHGPLGSSMGYLVTLQGAIKLRASALPMFLPYDVALERAWSYGTRTLVTKEPLIRISGEISTIGGYRHTKFPFYRRVPTALFRGQEYVRRTIYALGK